jgi:hypothetical protein
VALEVTGQVGLVVEPHVDGDLARRFALQEACSSLLDADAGDVGIR